MTYTPIQIYNSLHKKIEEFKPVTPSHISMYSCGPTVYNHVHIGNLRAYVCADIIRRTFLLNDFDITHIMNVTDIGHLQHDEIDAGEDKMTLALKREGKELTLESMREVAQKYYDSFRSDFEQMNILPADLYPFASQHIEDDISFISELLSKKHAYTLDDGVYFDTASIPQYGELGGLSDENTSESRILHTNHGAHKKNQKDFSLWKFNTELGYPSPFGKGFPGWHIECSVMSMKYLDTNNLSTHGTTESSNWSSFKTFDLHTGGTDHISVHHNNEIAQTRAISGNLLANYWVHNAHVIMEGGKKMAKSGGNFITLESLLEADIKPLDIRYWFLGAKYRTPINYSIEALHDAKRARENILKIIATTLSHTQESAEPNTDEVDQFKSNFLRCINNDFDTPNALALLWTTLRDVDSAYSPDTKIACVEIADTIFALNLMSEAKTSLTNLSKEIPTHIKDLAEKRKEARQNKLWAESDALRETIQKHGYDIIDSPDNSYTILVK